MSLGTLDWETVRPATAIGKTFGYFDIPAFSFDSAWLGASVIVAQYNLSLSRNFVLRNRPAKPANSNCLLTIRYRVGSTVYRYKLWNDDNCTLQADLYEGQVIKKNCVIEIWSLSTSTNMSQAAVMRLYTSLMQIVTDFTITPADYADATAALNLDEFSQNIYPLPSTNLLAQYKSDAGITLNGSGFVSGWANQISGNFNLVGAGTVLRFNGSGPNGYPEISVTGASLQGVCPLAGLNRGIIYAVMKQPSWNLSNNIFAVANNALASCASLVQYSVTPKVAGFINGALTAETAMPIDEWHIISFAFEVGIPIVYAQVDDLPITSAGAATNNSDLLVVQACDYTEILAYSSGSMALSPGFSDDVKNYLAAKYALSYPLPMAFSDNSSWLDNT
jgi:hypothetical protein